MRDLEFGASPNAFVQRAGERRPARLLSACAIYDEQSYWTIVGVDGDSEEGLLSEDGAHRSAQGRFLDRAVHQVTATRWLTWADVEIEHSLADGYLPMPSRAVASCATLDSSITALSAGRRAMRIRAVTYRVSNPTQERPHRSTLALAVRPFQVNPPAQFLNTLGGVSPIQDLALQERPCLSSTSSRASFRARHRRCVVAVPVRCGYAVRMVDVVHAASIACMTKAASRPGALLYDLELPPGEQPRRSCSICRYTRTGDRDARPAAGRADVVARWREKLNRVRAASCRRKHRRWFDTLRTALAHVLINRDGPGIQPGSRSYERSWIRDGAMTSEMLLRLGHEDVVKEFLLWYAPLSVRQRQDAVLRRPARRRSGAGERQRRRIPVPDRRDCIGTRGDMRAAARAVAARRQEQWRTWTSCVCPSARKRIGRAIARRSTA